MSILKTLQTGLKRLKLRRVREILESDGEREKLTQFKDPVTLVAHLVSEEVTARNETQKELRLRAAKFPGLKTLNDFDFEIQPAVNEARVRMLANLEFIRAKQNVIFLGPSGVGKTHLAVSLGYEAVKAGFKVRFTTVQELADNLYSSLADGNFKRELERYGKFDLLIIDELGFLSLDKTASNHFFQVINQAYEQQAVIVTSNRPFQEWSGVFYDSVIVTAILDRLLHHAHLFNLKGDSYRLKDHLKRDGKEVTPLN